MRQAAVHVWKSVVVNTPKTLRTVMPRLLEISIEAISSSGEERQAMAGKCLGELVRKMGNQVLPLSDRLCIVCKGWLCIVYKGWLFIVYKGFALCSEDGFALYTNDGTCASLCTASVDPAAALPFQRLQAGLG